MAQHQSSHSANYEALAALSALGLLAGCERRHFECHVAMCDRCQMIITQDRQTIALLSMATGQMEPSPEFKPRLLRRAARELANEWLR